MALRRLGVDGGRPCICQQALSDMGSKAEELREESGSISSLAVGICNTRKHRQGLGIAHGKLRADAEENRVPNQGSPPLRLLKS